MSDVESEGSLRCGNSSLFHSLLWRGERKKSDLEDGKINGTQEGACIIEGKIPPRKSGEGHPYPLLPQWPGHNATGLPNSLLCSVVSLSGPLKQTKNDWKCPPLEEKLQVSENMSWQGVLLQVPPWGEEGDDLGQNPKLVIFCWHLGRTVPPRCWCSPEQPNCFTKSSKQGVKTSSSSSAFCILILPS